jgi:hypothetical protein
VYRALARGEILKVRFVGGDVVYSTTIHHPSHVLGSIHGNTNLIVFRDFSNEGTLFYSRFGD